ncbi:MAG: elongation factor P [Bacilli bacterium]|nr:elongation factor P [Bacilli bacterium]
MFNVNDIKTGITFLYEGNIYTVLEFSHVKPGKGAAFVQAKLRNLKSGSTTVVRFNSGIKLEKAMIEKKEMQFLYANGDTFNFMNMETYEQIELDISQIGDAKDYLKEGLNVYISFYQGELLGLMLPDKVELTITHTEPAVKGNTTTNATKDATLETGLVIRVPLFIEEGEVIVVATSDGEYCGRA